MRVSTALQWGRLVMVPLFIFLQREYYFSNLFEWKKYFKKFIACYATRSFSRLKQKYRY